VITPAGSAKARHQRLFAFELRPCGYAARAGILTVVLVRTYGIYFIRSLAAWHLGRLGPRHPGIEAAVPELRELLNDNDPSARAEALVALGNLAGKGAPPAELKSLSAHG
jgi:hypothetical protein